MIDFLINLFHADFMPHGHCYFWRPEILWLHIISDVIIFISYLSIPFALVVFLKKRKDLPFKGMFIMFCAFIILCGLTHIFAVLTTFKGYYRAEGVLKGLTAITSVLTAYSLWPLIPKALSIPSKNDLEKINNQLLLYSENLEAKVNERTEKLKQRNIELEMINEVHTHREDRILELKNEVNFYAKKLGEQEPYHLKEENLDQKSSRNES